MKQNPATNVTLTLRSAAAPRRPPLYITYSEVLRILMEEAGLREREARALVQQNQPPPIPHQIHSRRLWLPSEVHAFCRKLINPES